MIHIEKYVECLGARLCIETTGGTKTDEHAVWRAHIDDLSLINDKNETLPTEGRGHSPDHAVAMLVSQIAGQRAMMNCGTEHEYTFTVPLTVTGLEDYS